MSRQTPQQSCIIIDAKPTKEDLLKITTDLKTILREAIAALN